MVDNDMIYSQLWTALNNSKVDHVLSLLRDNDINIDYRDVSHDLQTFLMRVCYVKLETPVLLDILEAIFDQNPDVNIRDSWGRTVLIHACISNKPVIIEGLLDYENTDPSLVDFDGNSALSYSVQNCDTHTLEDLLCHPSGPKLLTVLNTKGQSPYTLAQKNGDKAVLRLLKPYLNTYVDFENKNKRKPRNREAIKLPPTYSPSPERNFRNRSANKEVQYVSTPRNNSPASMNVGAGTGLKLDINATKEYLNTGRQPKEKCESAPVTRNDRMYDKTATLSLSSAKLIRRHHKNDCLLQETLLFNQSRNFPQVQTEKTFTNKSGQEFDIPDYSLRKQRRPSLSLPDLRNVSGFLVNSGSSTPTTECDDDYDRDDDDDDDNVVGDDYDDVFSHSCPRASSKSKSNSSFIQQNSERQITLPDINKGRTHLLSPASKRKGVIPLMRNRKCSSSDDLLHHS